MDAALRYTGQVKSWAKEGTALVTIIRGQASC
jgi:hypothetical protein